MTGVNAASYATTFHDATFDPPGVPYPRVQAGKNPLASERLVALAAAVGLFVASIDLDTVGAPSSLPLSSLTWLLIGASWSVPVLLLGSSSRWALSGGAWWLLSLFALALASSMWSIDPTRSLAAAVASTLIFVGGLAATSQLGWKNMVRVASVSLGAFTTLGLFRDVAFDSLVSNVPSVLAGERRFSGLTFSPTDLGRIASFAILLSTMACFATSGRERRFHVAAVLLGGAALVTSGTRLVAFALACVAIMAIVRRRSRIGIAIVAVITVALVAVAVNPGRVVEMVGRPGESDGHVLEFAGRTPVWSAAVELWSERPLLGYGWASNETVFDEAFARDTIGFNAYTAHNLGIGVLIDVGVVGLTMLVLGLIAVWRSTRYRPGARLVVLLVLLTGTIEATFSRPALVMALLGAVAAGPIGASTSRTAIDE